MGNPLLRSRRYSVSSVRGEYSEWPVTKNSRPLRAITIYTPASSDSESRVSPGNFQNIFLADLRVAAVGNIKHIVKTTENGIQRLQGAMREYAEHFLVQRILGYTVMVVESGLRRPANIKRGRNVRTRPIKYFGYLVPVGHFLKVHLLHRAPVIIIPSYFSSRILSKSV